jgi:hypothetical protein
MHFTDYQTLKFPMFNKHLIPTKQKYIVKTDIKKERKKCTIVVHMCERGTTGTETSQ